MTIGATTMVTETNIQIFSDQEATGRIKLEPSTEWSYSLGAKGLLFSYKGTSLGTEFQYFRCDPSLKKSRRLFLAIILTPHVLFLIENGKQVLLFLIKLTFGSLHWHQVFRC